MSLFPIPDSPRFICYGNSEGHRWRGHHVFGRKADRHFVTLHCSLPNSWSKAIKDAQSPGITSFLQTVDAAQIRDLKQARSLSVTRSSKPILHETTCSKAINACSPRPYAVESIPRFPTNINRSSRHLPQPSWLWRYYIRITSRTPSAILLVVTSKIRQDASHHPLGSQHQPFIETTPTTLLVATLLWDVKVFNPVIATPLSIS